MAEEPRVEVIIRKKPTFTPNISVNAPSFKTPSKGLGMAVKYLVILIILVAVGFGAYKFLPKATSFVLAGFGEPFDYTITAKAIETFMDEGDEVIHFIEESGSKVVKMDSATTVKLLLFDGENLNQATSFGVKKGDSVSLNFDYFGDGGSVKVSKNGVKVFSDLRTDIKGAELQYKAIIEHNEERTATQEGTAKVSRNGKEKKIIEVTATPEAEKEGELGKTTYDLATTNENVKLEVKDGFLYAQYVKPTTEEAK